MKSAREPSPSIESKTSPSRGTLRGLDWLNFLLADVQTGVGPFVAIYLAGYWWNEERVGLALTVGGIAGILTQTPAGALVDFLRSKRALVGVAVAALAAGALLIALFPSFWPVLAAQVLIGGTSSVFIPAICAMSLGIVGRAAFDTRQGRNQTFNSAGNVTAALSMGLLGYLVSNRSIFFFVVALAVPTIFVLLLIRPDEIDYEVARGANDGEKAGKAESVRVLFRDRPLVLFLVCAVMFHFANAALLPLLGELLAKGQGRSSMLFMSACVVTTQFVITLVGTQGRNVGSKAPSADRVRRTSDSRCSLHPHGQYGIARGHPGYGRRRGGDLRRCVRARDRRSDARHRPIQSHAGSHQHCGWHRRGSQSGHRRQHRSPRRLSHWLSISRRGGVGSVGYSLFLHARDAQHTIGNGVTRATRARQI